MRKELQMLRTRMQETGIDAYLIMTDDFHGSEYVGDYFKCREYISGFTGSAGVLLVMKEKAGLWTDGRYFLQAQKQLAGSGITLYRSGQPGVPSLEEFLEKQLTENMVLGFDGRCVMADYAGELEEKMTRKKVRINTNLDLVGEIWKNRPALSKEPVWILEENYAGKSRKEKIAEVRKKMQEQNAQWFLLASLEDICWLLNVRGNDVECTPVVLSYLLMSEQQLYWYVQTEAVPASVRNTLAQDGVILREYEEIYTDVAGLPKGTTVLADRGHLNAALVRQISADVTTMDVMNPTCMLKAVKNPVEVENERIAHLRDGVAVTRFLFWIKQKIGRERITECSAAARLEEFRREQEHYLGASFAPIMAYGAHGAIVHYSADAQSDAECRPEGFLLADTGGHYREGTTDITRTIALGPLTREEQELYTTVLRGHIHLSDARFLRGCTGVSLDGLARMPLWEKGYDYNHGTGHGVGYLLSVHEGPNSFRYRPSAKRGNDCVLEEGMITSNEPGVYLEGKFGIRLENLLVCVRERENGYGRFLHFEPLTMVPFERAAILPEKMTRQELHWLDTYHRRVRETLSPYLTEEENLWLATETAPFGSL